MAVTEDFWDVGQADCSVITFPDDSVVIVDVGTKASPLVDYLRARPREIRAIVLTHNHADHAGAMPTIVHEFKDRIRKVVMLDPPRPQDEKFQRIFRPVAAAFESGIFDVQRLDAGRPIADEPSVALRIDAVYPSFVAGVLAHGNKNCGIVCLRIEDDVKVVWPGDVGLDDLFENCDGMRPTVLVGPHHGAPDKHDHAYAPAWIHSVGSKRAFISVGTNNQPTHPRPGYLHVLTSSGCKVICSQLTDHCDRVAVRKGRPIFPSHGLLGLPAPTKGVPCRGAFRLHLRGTALVPDRWDAEHLSRISRLRRPQCLTGYFARSS